MDHFVEGALMNIIHRRAIILKGEEPYLEVNFRSMENPIGFVSRPQF